MAAYSTSLFVQVSPEGRDLERLEHKLGIYFQSAKRSKGGECLVRAQDLERGIYSVQFQSEEVKNRVKEHGPHIIEVSGWPLEINILPDSEMLLMNWGEASHKTNLIGPTASSFSASSSLPLQNDLEKKKLDEKYSGGLMESVTRKIFLSVSATLNTELLTREQRDQVTAMCPTLKMDVVTSHTGVEKVSGDYSDIEKLHCHFEKLLKVSCNSSSEFSYPKGQNTLGEMFMEDQKEKSKNDVEEVSDMEVPSAILEYFCEACKEQVNELEQKFSVKLTGKKHGNGMTSLQFISVGDPSLLEKAQQTFATAFQKVAANLKQEIISFSNSHQLAKAQELLNIYYKNILVKMEGNTLILRGPTMEVLAAKSALGKAEAGVLAKAPETHSLKTGIEVDLNIFKFLEPELFKEIAIINQKYNTELQKKNILSSQKVCIIFKPTKHENSDRSSQAYDCFRYAYQKMLAVPKEKDIPLKLSENQRRKLNELFPALQRENPRVSIYKTKNKLILKGFPEQVCSLEKHIMWFLNMDVDPSEGKVDPAIPSSSVAEMKGANSKQNGDHKVYSPPAREKADLKEMEVKEEEKCTICMDKFRQKKVLDKCKHEFCAVCIEMAMKYKPVCPICNVPYGKVEGNQPPGTMNIFRSPCSLPGYHGCGTIEIAYDIPSGTQTKNHPKPGNPFHGTHRRAYLPDNHEGKEILKLLQRAFNQKLIFTVGQSRTTGATDVVTWNDIHHKTSQHGGPNSFGYPDPDYLKRVREELKAKGIQ